MSIEPSAPQVLPAVEGPTGDQGPVGATGEPGEPFPWRMYIMGDHPEAIPGTLYREPGEASGWLAMGDAYVSSTRSGEIAGQLALFEPTQPNHAATKQYVDNAVVNGTGVDAGLNEIVLVSASGSKFRITISDGGDLQISPVT